MCLNHFVWFCICRISLSHLQPAAGSRDSRVAKVVASWSGFSRIHSIMNDVLNFYDKVSLVLGFLFWAKHCLRCRHLPVFKPQLSRLENLATPQEAVTRALIDAEKNFILESQCLGLILGPWWLWERLRWGFGHWKDNSICGLSIYPSIHLSLAEENGKEINT